MERVQAEFLLQHDYCVTLTQLAQTSGLSAGELQELQELGALAARETDSGWLFAADCLALTRIAQRLRHDFDLSLPGIALALAYRQRIAELEQRLRAMECELPRGR